MAVPIQATSQWPGLTREQLIEPLRAAVRHQFLDEQFWFGVRGLMAEHAVLAAHIRGLLSQIDATMRGTADEPFWSTRVEKVRAHLAPPQAPHDAQVPMNQGRAQVTAEDPAIRVPLIERPPPPTRATRPAVSVPPVVFQSPLPSN